MARKKRRASGGAGSGRGAAPPLTEVTRAQMAAILRRADAGEELPDEEAEMARAMQRHPEYRAIFMQGAAAREEVDGVNPWLHVSLHTVVERQRRHIPEVDAAITRLMLRGVSEHEAEHRIAELLTHQIWAMMNNGQSFSEREYLEQLRTIG